MTDQQRYDSLGCYGFRGVRTPNLDRMAAEGVVFENCYVNNPICTPSRASLFTGKHLPGHGVHRLYDILPDTEVLFSHRLREAGYRTALFGKLHVSAFRHEIDHRHPNDGFEVFESCHEPSLLLDHVNNAYGRWLAATDPVFFKRLLAEGRNLRHVPREVHMTHWAAQRTIDFIQERRRSEPFFCMMSLFDPHNPYTDYPKEMEVHLNPAQIPGPVGLGGDMSERPEAHRREHAHGYCPFTRHSPDDLRDVRTGYFASIALIDLEVGRVLSALDESGLAGDTLVIFASDHGDMLGDHQLMVKGAFFYDPCVRVPLIMRWPARMPAGRRIEALVQLHDLAATILAAGGVEPDFLADVIPCARDLAPLTVGETTAVHDQAVCLYRGSGIDEGNVYFDPPINGTMLRHDHWKLNLYHDPADAARIIEGELYDMRADPDELEDLWNSAAHRDVRRRLTEMLADWLATHQ